jgi:hypothetical protein
VTTDAGDSPPPKTSKSALHKNEVGYYYYKHFLDKAKEKKTQKPENDSKIRDWNDEFQVQDFYRFF